MKRSSIREAAEEESLRFPVKATRWSGVELLRQGVSDMRSRAAGLGSPWKIPEATASAQPRVSPWAIFMLSLLAIVPYLNALKDGFAFDDIPDIVHNPVVSNGIDVLRMFSTPLTEYLYRPFTVLTFAINQWLTPGNPFAFHAVNLVLHAAVTILVFFLALRLFASTQIAVVAGALFAVHPVHTEAVTNIVGRAELLAALFALGTLLSVARADRAGGARERVQWNALALIWFSLGLLSKESAVTVLPLIPLVRITLRGDPLGAGLWQEFRSFDWLPYLLCVITFTYVRFLVVGVMGATSISALDNVLAFVPTTVRIRSAFGVLWDYFGLLNVPLVLAADYSYGQVPLVRSWLDARFLGGISLIIAAGIVLIRNRRPAVTFVAIFPFVALSITANVLFPIGTIKAERLLYLPSVGWIILVAYGFDRLLRASRYRRLGIALLVTVITLYSIRTWLRNWDWQNNTTLYSSMVKNAPNSAKARYNLGVALQKEGADGIAAAQFRRALELFPWAGGEGSPVGLGILAEKHGDFDGAVRWYQKALNLNPGCNEAHIDLCRLLLLLGRYREAARACRDGLRYVPANTSLLKGLGGSLLGLGHRDKGIRVLRWALALEKQDPQLRARLAELEGAAHTRKKRTVR